MNVKVPVRFQLAKWMAALGVIGLLLVHRQAVLGRLKVNLAYVELTKSLTSPDNSEYPWIYDLTRDRSIHLEYSPQRLSQAEMNFRQALTHDSENGLALWGLGRIAWTRGNYAEAADLFARAAQSEPDNSAMLLYAGHTLLLIGDEGQAVAYWRKAAGPSMGMQLVLAGALLSSRMLPAALEVATGALDASRTEGQRVLAHGLIGQILYYDRDFDTAIEHLGQAAELEPENGFWHWWLGRAFRKQGDLQQSITEARLAVELVPRNWMVRLDLGRSYLGAELVEQAIPELEQAVELTRNPGDEKQARFYLGEAYWEMGMKDLAISEWERALELDPQFQAAQERIDQARE